MILDRHHLILYGAAFVILCALAGVAHSWRMDVAAAKIKSDAREEVFKAAAEREADRQKQFDAAVKQINRQRVTIKTPPAELLKRLQGLEPSMSVLPDQLVAPKPDAPKVNLSLDPAQQVTLVNRLADCKVCDAERIKLSGDLGEERGKRLAVEEERDAFRNAAKGGSLWNRIKRRAWHFAEDAVIIEAARCIGGHC